MEYFPTSRVEWLTTISLKPAFKIQISIFTASGFLSMNVNLARYEILSLAGITQSFRHCRPIFLTIYSALGLFQGGICSFSMSITPL